MQAYDTATAYRERAAAWSDKAEVTNADLRAALAELQQGLDYLATTSVRELAEGNVYLRYRRFNIDWDRALLHARLNEPDKVADVLASMRSMHAARTTLDGLASNTDFARLLRQPSPILAAELARWRGVLNAIDSNALQTPYRDRLPLPERIAGLSLFWHYAKNYFVHFDGTPGLDWDAAYRDAIPAIVAADSTERYYRELMKFAAKLSDGHSNVYPPESLQNRFYSRPPMRTQLVEGRVLITEVFSEKLRQKGLAVGQEILRIDGQPVLDYAAQHVTPYVSSSTEQDRLVRSFHYELLAGPSDQPIKLHIAAADESARTISVARGGYVDVESSSAFEHRWLAGGLLYLALDHFESDAGYQRFQMLLPELLKANGLILDVRRNGGGSSEHGWNILAHLLRQPFATLQSSTRIHDGLRQVHERQMNYQQLPPETRSARTPYFNGPVAVLIGPQTFSAAEDFVVLFDAHKRGLLIGEATAGSTGQPLFFPMPGGGSARLCVKRDSYPDGTAFVGVGVQPDIEIKPTIAGIRRNEDEVLVKAQNALRSAALLKLAPTASEFLPSRDNQKPAEAGF